MIITTAPPRQNLTDAQVVALLVSPSISISSGLEIIDPVTLVATEDISDKLLGGNVRRDNYATLHGSCSLDLSEYLFFNGNLFRPYMNITDKETGVTARFNLGAYYITNPTTPLPSGSVTAEGFDILLSLHDPVGDTYSVSAGANYIDTVVAILASRGLTATIEPSATTLQNTRVWAMDDDQTWLDICNGLLSAAGYRNMWSDEDGALRSDQYMPTVDRAAEWAYDATSARTIVGMDRAITADTFQAPNRWVFIRSNPSGGATVAGNGIYEFENINSGPTSSSVLGRVVTKVERLEAASQADLVAQATAIIERDSGLDAILDLSTGPNPLHWHFDVVSYADVPALFLPAKYSARSWQLNLVTGNMAHVWKSV
jgi:hypothetical protein